jgi:hypothetical protein
MGLHVVFLTTSSFVADRLEEGKSFAAPWSDAGDHDPAERSIHSTLEAR